MPLKFTYIEDLALIVMGFGDGPFGRARFKAECTRLGPL